MYRLSLSLISGLLACSIQAQAAAPKNIIMMISDGFGPSGVTLGRYSKGEPLAMDTLLVGSARTYSSDSLVTDSAAGATAYSAGTKTYNGAIAVNSEQRPLRTLLEAAQEKGMRTGMVVTTDITDATPASFSAHARDRSMQESIAEQEIAHKLDIMLGGGKQYFLPSTRGGARTDNRDLLHEAHRDGVNVIDNLPALKKAESLPLIGLFTQSYLPYDIDRKEHHTPSLEEMTSKSLELLTQNNEQGFFLLIEGSRIDHGGHANDVAAEAREILAYDRTIALVKKYIEAHPDTLMVSTSDHETGGLTLGRMVEGKSKMVWHVEPVLAATRSLTGLTEACHSGEELSDLAKSEGFEWSDLASQTRSTLEDAFEQSNCTKVARILVDEVAERSHTGWTTYSHTAVDVNVYAYGEGRERFIGNQENIEVGQKIADLMGVKIG